MTDDKERAEELLSSSQDEKRHQTEPAQSTTPTEAEEPTLAEAVAQAYDDLEEGDLYANLTVRDENLAALVSGLDAAGKLDDLTEAANGHLGRNGEVGTKAALLKALIRVGISEVDADVLEAAKEGKKQHLTEQADNF